MSLNSISATPQLNIAMLGPPSVLWQRQSIAIPRRQTRALLYRLAAAEQPVSRDQLGFLFWPDESTTTSRRKLTHLLTHLRRALPDPDVISIAGDWLQLDARFTRVDVSLLRSAATTDDPKLLRQVIDVYRGIFLESFSVSECPEYDQWVTEERMLLERQFLTVLERAVTRACDSGDMGFAVTLGRRYLAFDPIDEPMHRLLMRLLVATGDRGAALRQYTDFVVYLDREFSLDPEPETLDLYEAIQAGRPIDVPRPTHPSPSQALDLTRQLSSEPVGRGALPMPLTPIIGRDRERDIVAALLQKNEVRLVTIIGPGGVGKTRLALAVADMLRDVWAGRVVFLSLAALADPALVLLAVAHTLGIEPNGAQTVHEQIVARLSAQRTLLVLDNFEHLREARTELARLLHAARPLTVLVTSRASLNISGEHVFALDQLSTPDLRKLPTLGAAARYPAVQLFVERAKMVRSSFVLTNQNLRDVAIVCARLDGLPLAIELAAARLQVLQLSDLVARLSERLRLLTNGPRDLPARQQTLRATLDWSYTLLDPVPQILLARLAVFSGSWSLDEAEQICSDTPGQVRPDLCSLPRSSVLDAMSALVDQSLVLRLDDESGARFAMLETVHEYAQELLEASDKAHELRRRHAQWYFDLCALAADAPYDVEETWHSRLDAAYSNIRAAWAWWCGSGAALEPVRLCGMLWRYWWSRGHVREGRAWLDAALALPYPIPEEKAEHIVWVKARARALYCLGVMAHQQYDLDRARKSYEASLALSQSIDAIHDMAFCLNDLGIIADESGRYSDGERSYRASLELKHQLEQSVEVRHSIAKTLDNLGFNQAHQGFFEQAADIWEQTLAIRYELDDRDGLANTWVNQAYTALYCCDYTRARALLASCLTYYRAANHSFGIADVMMELGLVACAEGAFEEARGYLGEGVQMWYQRGWLRGVVDCAEGLAMVALAAGAADHAMRIVKGAWIVRHHYRIAHHPVEVPAYQRLCHALGLVDQSVHHIERPPSQALQDVVTEAMLVANPYPTVSYSA